MSDTEFLDAWVADVTALATTADRSAARREGARLLARWREPHRSYHTLQHLAEMLSAIDELAATTGLTARETRLAHIAAWLHDAVYDVHAATGNSERESARLARTVLAKLGFGASDRQVVSDLILLTIDHGAQLPGSLADVFADADLAILAAPESRFDEYCAQVRAEYAHVPDAAYGTGRSQILVSIVDRPDTYRTHFARTAWTAAAGANVGREIDRLARCSRGSR